MVSVDEGSIGFDVLSFTDQGEERHIEVKSTTRSAHNDIGFWLTENERMVAETDYCWTLYRVWNIDTDGRCEDFGNVVRDGRTGWLLEPSSWCFSPNGSEQK